MISVESEQIALSTKQKEKFLKLMERYGAAIRRLTHVYMQTEVLDRTLQGLCADDMYSRFHDFRCATNISQASLRRVNRLGPHLADCLDQLVVDGRTVVYRIDPKRGEFMPGHKPGSCGEGDCCQTGNHPVVRGTSSTCTTKVVRKNSSPWGFAL